MIKIIDTHIAKGSTIEYWTQPYAGHTIAIGRTTSGVCYIGFADHIDELQSRFPLATLQPIEAQIELNAIDAIHMNGTEFQMAVWRELLGIQAGQTTSYTAIAHAIGRPRAVRAVGSAVGRNPISIVVPCHRVLRSDGAMGGYYWGERIKGELLSAEKAQR